MCVKTLSKALLYALCSTLPQWGGLGSLPGPTHAAAEPPPGMVALPASVYTPLYSDQTAALAVEAFYLDTYAVTRAQYLAFVQANPPWRRRHIPRLFAETAYLQSWPDDLPVDEASTTWGQSPVTQVSWFAARAYCKWQGKRLPTVAEWEYAAMASDTAPDGRQDAGYLARILAWYAQPTPDKLPAVGSTGRNYWGVYDLHGLVWEWTADFHTALVTGESRGDSNLERDLFCGAGVVGTSGQERVNYPAFMRYAYRSSLRGSYTVANLGFRCAKDTP